MQSESVWWRSVKLSKTLILSNEPGIPWSDIARMRDLLTHRYFDTVHSIVFTTARNDIPMLATATNRLLSSL